MSESIPRLLMSITFSESCFKVYILQTTSPNIQFLSLQSQQILIAFHSTASKYASSLSVYSS